MSSTTITNRSSVKGISHEVKDWNLVLTFSSLVDVGYIGSMMFIMMDFHCWGINVRLKGVESIWKVW